MEDNFMALRHHCDCFPVTFWHREKIIKKLFSENLSEHAEYRWRDNVLHIQNSKVCQIFIQAKINKK